MDGVLIILLLIMIAAVASYWPSNDIDSGASASITPGYYGAFVLEPDGNNIEVVNHNRR